MTPNFKYIVLTTAFFGVLSLPVEEKNALQEFINGNYKFTSALYKEVLKEQTENFIFSPVSAEIILALTNEGAKGNTSQELVTGLWLPKTKERIQEAVKLLQSNFKKSNENLQLLSANKIYVDESFSLEDSFKSVANTIYNAGVDNIDFSKNIEAAATINDWIEVNTNHKIQNMISPDALTNLTKMVLINALYFNGRWQSKFETSLTWKKQFFKTNESSVEVDTMFKLGHFNYHENPELDAKFLELPYKGGDVSMVVVLPNQIDGLGKLEQNMETVLAPQPYVNSWTRIFLPKFTIESTIHLVPILMKLGVKKIFSDDSDLTGLSSTHEDLIVDDVIQKAFINVTESGTEAAAVTTVTFFSRFGGDDFQTVEYEFNADHPFLYFIKSNGLVLFAGRYINGE